jgi:hypothetical protein
MRFAREDVTPEWQAGNSHAEYRARQAATEIASMLRCALKAHDPLAEMWRELAEYQEQANTNGHGESWRIMCEERTKDSARDAARDVAGAAAGAAASEAAWAASAAASVAQDAQRAIAAIRGAKGVKP